MSKKRRLMSEEEQLAPEEEQLLSEVIKEGLDSTPKVSITPEELIAIAKADNGRLEKEINARRRKRFVKYAGMAAMLILVCVALFAVIRPGNAVPADADKSAEKQVEKNVNDVVIKDKDTEGDSGAGTIETADWDKVRYLKKGNTTLYIPEYVPEEYRFQSAKLEEFSTDIYKLSYVFRNEENKPLTIWQESSNNKYAKATYAKDSKQQVDTKFGEAYITKNKNGNMTTAILISDNQLFRIQGNLTIKELIKICDNLEFM